MSATVVARIPLRAMTSRAAASMAARVCLPRSVGNCSRGATVTGDLSVIETGDLNLMLGSDTNFDQTGAPP
jgi:hypothetical protein